jgi:uncharacterized protein YdeI (YjbR/CyaY-like superfamily)
MVKTRDEVTWFASPAEWRAWLEEHHDTERELWVGIAKVHIEDGVHYLESVEEALCFGWIDGLTHGVDADGYAIRYTPRKPKGNWTETNVQRVEALIAAGRMHESGLRAFANRPRSDPPG